MSRAEIISADIMQEISSENYASVAIQILAVCPLKLAVQFGLGHLQANCNGNRVGNFNHMIMKLWFNF